MRKLLALAAFAALAACSSDNNNSITATTSTNVRGAYSLSTVNAKSLPFVVSTDASGSRALTGAELNLGSDNTWTEVQSYKVTNGTSSTTATVTLFGTYSVSGSTVTLSLGSGSGSMTMSADAAGNTLTQTEGSTTYVFNRS